MIQQGIIFDLDGTLWDSSEAVVQSWNEVIRTFPDFHELIDVEKMRSYMGMPMDEIAYAFFHDLPRERALELMDICMANENAYILRNGGNLYDGLEDTLKELQGKYFLAIVSNCQKGYIEAFLEYHHLGQYFQDIESYGNTGMRKFMNIRHVIERNHMENAVYVGDTMGDYKETIRAAEKIVHSHPPVQLRFLHAAYGFGEVPEGTAFISDITELPKAAEQMFRNKR